MSTTSALAGWAGQNEFPKNLLLSVEFTRRPRQLSQNPNNYHLTTLYQSIALRIDIHRYMLLAHMIWWDDGKIVDRLRFPLENRMLNVNQINQDQSGKKYQPIDLFPLIRKSLSCSFDFEPRLDTPLFGTAVVSVHHHPLDFSLLLPLCWQSIKRIKGIEYKAIWQQTGGGGGGRGWNRRGGTDCS